MQPNAQPILLASSSRYRHQLLKKILADFDSAAPNLDESALPNESPTQLASRLGVSKAHALQTQFPGLLIIGSDQVACCGSQTLGKPGSREHAIAQLHLCNAQRVDFFTSICVLNARTGEYRCAIDNTQVYFRSLTTQQIEHYVDREQPYDSAGSFKAEALGIALFDKIESTDPNALIGLPLIKLIQLLESFDVQIL